MRPQMAQSTAQTIFQLGALSVSMALSPLDLSTSHAASVEGGDPSLLKQKSHLGGIRSRNWARRDAMREALRSVISMRIKKTKGTEFCSASLVAKKILLTSQHCTDSPENPNDRLKTGTPLTLNGQAGFAVQDVIRFGRSYAGPSDSPSLQTNTDLALIRVERAAHSGTSRNFLDSLPILPIATPEVAATLDDQILVSGYGVKSWYSEQTGTLRYGVAKKIDQIETSVGKADLSLQKNPELTPQLEFAQGQFYIVAVRTEVKALKSKKSFPVQQEDFVRYTQLDGNPMVLPGDSGAPAIAFDDAHRPYLIGVTSMTIANALHSDLVLSAFRDHRFGNPTPLFQVSVPLTSLGLQSLASFDVLTSSEDTQKGIFDFLAREKLLDEKGFATAPFILTETMTRLAIGIYTSTSHPLNQQFILNKISSLNGGPDSGPDPERNPQR